MLKFMLIAALGFAAPAYALEAGAKVAFLGITFLDTSTEGAYNGARDDETARVDLAEARVRERFTEAGLDLVDTSPVAERLAATANPAECYGCDVRMGEELGADYVLVGEIQKVSNLILSMNLVLRRVPDGAFVRGMSADIRSNTDESWLRGINYIMKNNIFQETP